MKYYAVLTILAIFASTLVFKASNQAKIEKLKAPTESVEFCQVPVSGYSVVEPSAPVIFVMHSGAGYLEVIELLAHQSEVLPVILIVDQVPDPDARYLNEYLSITKLITPQLYKDCIIPDPITIGRTEPNFAPWKPWGKVWTKYKSPWLFEPVKIC